MRDRVALSLSREVSSLNEAVQADTQDVSGQPVIKAEFYDQDLEGAVFNGACLVNANWQGVNPTTRVSTPESATFSLS